MSFRKKNGLKLRCKKAVVLHGSQVSYWSLNYILMPLKEMQAMKNKQLVFNTISRSRL